MPTRSNPPKHLARHLSRRTALLAPMAALAAAGLPNFAFALTDAQAVDLIGRVVADINSIINSGKSEAAMIRDFEALFNRYADVPIIARIALGVPWRTASSSQRSRYVSAFRGYISRKYGKRFREFIGGTITVTGSRKVKSGYLVSSIASLKGSAPFALDWQVSDKSGKDKMFNLYIEGISLLATERTEVAAMLDQQRGDINALIAAIKAAG
ncbi:MAG: ABC transporter substrate-binding protein [Alphaproteobacteria bacterium]|nr:ABC transporter substrate-binding protein [Alphaproteobacteria bacterium]